MLRQKNGFDYHIDIHIKIEANLSVTEGHNVADLVKDTILHSNLRMINVMVHVELYNQK